MSYNTEDKVFAAAGCVVAIIWFIGAILSLALTGVIIYALWEGAQWLSNQ